MFKLAGRRWAIFLLCIPAFPVFGQDANPPRRASKPVTPIPAYTAEFKTVHVRTLANGTTITTETTEVRARDSQGRNLMILTRTPLHGVTEFKNGSIDDPVENTRIIWNSHDKKAKIIRLPVQDQRHGCWTSVGSPRITINYGSDVPPPSTTATAAGGGAAGSAMVGAEVGEVSKTEETRKDLGTTTIQGLEARGMRFTSVIPAGKVGNDIPITTTREVWHVPGFPFALREAFDDPRSGKTTRETVSLTIGEPDLVMFQPPEGYEAVNVEMVPCQQ